LRDLLEVAIALEPEILDVLPHDLVDLRDLLPEEYQGLLSHHEPGQSMPHFRSQAIEPDWAEAARELLSWWTGERRSGRQWALTADVVSHRLVAVLDTCGLPSQLSAPMRQVVRPNQLDVEWAAGEVQLRLVWLDPLDEPDADAVHKALQDVGQQLWNLASTSGCDESVLLIAASRNVHSNLVRTTHLARVDESVTLSIQEAHKLGVEGADVHVHDVQASLLYAWGPESPFLWLAVKSSPSSST